MLKSQPWILRHVCIALLVFSAVFISCEAGIDTNVLNKTMNALKASNFTIRTNTKDLLGLMSEKAFDPVSAEKAKPWVDRLKTLWSKTDDIVYTVSKLKEKIVEKKVANEVELELKDYLSFIDEIAYKKLVDTALIATFKSGISNAFAGKSYSERLIISESIINSILISEYNIARYANINVMVIRGCGFQKNSAIVTQNSLYFKQGDVLEVMAGVGTFSKEQNPICIFDGQTPTEPNENGVAIFKKKINQGKGKYNLPVVVKYMDQEGNVQQFERVLSYQVD
jgi:hypothetical protein